MWLHYGRSGRGLALAFEPTIASSVNMDLLRLDYEPTSQRRRIDELLDSGLAALGQNPTPAQLHDGAHVTSLYLSWLAIRLKHPSFVEEDEWRLSANAVAQAGQIQDGTIFRFRRSGERLVPYEERPFGELTGLEQVVLGHSSPLAIDAIGLF